MARTGREKMKSGLNGGCRGLNGGCRGLNGGLVHLRRLRGTNRRRCRATNCCCLRRSSTTDCCCAARSRSYSCSFCRNCRGGCCSTGCSCCYCYCCCCRDGSCLTKPDAMCQKDGRLNRDARRCRDGCWLPMMLRTTSDGSGCPDELCHSPDDGWRWNCRGLR